jgi:hypothetical protein
LYFVKSNKKCNQNLFNYFMLLHLVCPVGIFGGHANTGSDGESVGESEKKKRLI